MTGAIEFLEKVKAIHNVECVGTHCNECTINNICAGSDGYEFNSADLVRKVMDYQIKEVTK
jgi:hypothetical protein